MYQLQDYIPLHATWMIRTSNFDKIAEIVLSGNQKLLAEEKIFLTRKGEILPEVRLIMEGIYQPLRIENLSILAETDINYPTKVNLAKDIQYQSDGNLLERCTGSRDWNVASLAGARPLQISRMIRQKSGKFQTYHIDEKDFKTVDVYLKGRHQGYLDVKFSIKHQDILEDLVTTEEKYDYLDLDLCFRLDHERSDRILAAAKNSTKERSIVSVTHLHRQSSYQEIYTNEIPYLVNSFKTQFKEVNHVHNYYYNSVSMYRETFVINNA